jgi:nucleolar protein 53
VGEGEDDSEAEGVGVQDELSQQAACPEKKTKSKRNREARLREQKAELAAKQKLKAQRLQLQNLGDIQQEIEEAEVERELRQQRRKALQKEKAATEPPRLGKIKYQEAPVQVLSAVPINVGFM